MLSDTKPERGSERIKAWVYAILNPLIDSLRSETNLLKNGNLSWRLHSQRCEYIRPIGELIDPSHQPILEDCVAEDSILGEKFAGHDSLLANLEETATRFFDGLVHTKPFRKDVADSLAQYETMRARNRKLPDLSDLVNKAPEYIAEFIVNGVHSLPRHHTMYSFWEYFGPDLRQSEERKTFASVRHSADELLKYSEKLKNDLESRRLELVRAYDIAAAPIEPRRNTSAENVSFR